MPDWPEALPDFSLRQGYSEGFRQTVIRSEMSSGAVKRRKRFTASPKTLDIVVPLTGAEVNIFTSFYENELQDGSLSFTKIHPRLGTEQTFSFRSELEPLIAEGGNTYILKMKLEFVAGFSPKHISNLKLWLDATDTDTIMDSGEPNFEVSQWNDKSSEGNDVIQLTVADQPINGGNINGHNVITFGGSDHSLQREVFTAGTLEQPNSIFIVWELSVLPPGIEKIIDGGSGSDRHVVELPNTHIWRMWAGNNLNGTSRAINTPYITLSIFNKVSSEGYINGLLDMIGDVSDSAFNGITLGARFSGDNVLNGKIGEVIVYNRLVSSEEIDQVHSYLSDKWGVVLG